MSVASKYELNRLEYNILGLLFSEGCDDEFTGITITEMIEIYGVKAKRMTVWKKLKKMLSNGFVEKGLLEDHADTYFLTEKAKKLFLK